MHVKMKSAANRYTNATALQIIIDSPSYITCFSEAYTELEIRDVQLAYNISRGSVLDKER